MVDVRVPAPVVDVRVPTAVVVDVRAPTQYAKNEPLIACTFVR